MFLEHETGLYVAYYNDGEIIDTSFWIDEKFNRNFSKNEELITMNFPIDLRVDNESKKFINVRIDNQIYTNESEGTMIIIYNPITKEVEDKVFYNFSFSDIKNYWQ